MRWLLGVRDHQKGVADMAIDIADATVLAEMEVVVTAFRRQLREWRPIVERISAPAEIGGYAAVRDDLAMCLESVGDLIESIGDAPVAVA